MQEWLKPLPSPLATYLPTVAKKIEKKILREVFSKFFRHGGAPMHKTKNRGDRDLSVVKFSAQYDAWSSKKRKKQKLRKPSKYRQKSIKIEDFVKFLKIWAKYGFTVMFLTIFCSRYT